MLPTPAKFHYIFNLRDLSRIWQGMLNTVSDIIVDERSLMWLWKHECHRVIADRFTNQQDKDWFEKSLLKVVGEELGDELSAHVEETPYFVDFLRYARRMLPFDCRNFRLFSFCSSLFSEMNITACF